MATTFTLVTRYREDAATMFDRSLDIDLHVASMRGTGERAVAGVTSGSIGLGERVTWRARHFGVWWRLTSLISALERPRRFVDEQVSGPFRRFAHEHVFEDVEGGCRMTDTITVASPVFGALAERAVLVPYLRRLMRTRNETLRAAGG